MVVYGRTLTGVSVALQMSWPNHFSPELFCLYVLVYIFVCGYFGLQV